MSNDRDSKRRSIRVTLFASAKARAGQDTIRVEVSEGSTVQDLRTAIRDQIPELNPVISSLFVAVNAQYVGDNTVIPTDAEVACFPPVSGG